MPSIAVAFEATRNHSAQLAPVGVTTASQSRSPTPASVPGNRAAVTNPNWLPESLVAARPIPSTGKFYVATDGSDSNPGTLTAPFQTLQKAVNAASPDFVVLVRGGTYNQRVVFGPGKSGSPGQYITLAAYPGEEVIIDGANISLPPSAGLVEINGSYIRVSGFTIQNVSGTDNQMGILVRNTSHVVIDNNRTIKTASAGIGAWWVKSLIIRNNQVQDAKISGSQECLSVNESSNFEISFNVVWNTQRWSQDCEGIDIKNGSKFGRIVGNVAHDLPLECFYIDAFKNATHNIEIYGNLAYNCSIGIALNAEVNGALQNVNVFNNLIHDTFFIGIGFPAWGEKKGSISNVSVYNNTIDNSKAKNTSNPTGLYFRYPTMSNIMVQNNIIVTSGTAFIFETTVASLTVDHNLVSAATLSSGMTGFNDPNLVQGNPMFVNEYHLGASSPAIDRGKNSISLRFDFDGTSRPKGAAIDIGAFEFVP
jgi:nitrous oxidase accessory protein NosD